MKTRTHRRLTLASLCTLALALQVGCENGDDDPPPIPALTGDTTKPGVAGRWTVTASCDETQCGDGNTVETSEVTVEQNGADLTVTTVDGVFTGTIDDNGIVAWNGNYPEDGGTLTTQATWTVAVDGNNEAVSLTGSSTWSWTDGVEACSGTCTFTGTREEVAAPIDIAGAWGSSEICRGNCGDPVQEVLSMFEFVQDDSTITVITDTGVFVGTLRGRTMTWSGTILEDGGSTELRGTWIFSEDEMSYSGTSEWVFADGSDSCSGTCNYTGTRL